MKIQSKMALMMGLAVLVCVLGLAGFREWHQYAIRVFMAQRAAEMQSLLGSLLELKTRSVQSLVRDYTLWDDMVHFVEKPDPEWASDNLADTALATFDATAAIILNPAFKPVYQKCRDGVTLTLPPREDVVRAVFAKARLVHFFLSAKEGVCEVYGATIHPVKDLERKTPPAGYMLTVRLLDSDMLAELSRWMAGTVTVRSVARADAREELKFSPSGEFRVSRVLRDWNGRPAGVLEAVVVSYPIRVFTRLTEYDFLGIVGFLLFVFVLVLGSTARWVIMPVNRISRSLRMETGAAVRGMEARSDEFGTMARLIEHHANQQMVLRRHVAERVKTLKELQKSEEYLRTVLDSIQSGVMTIDQRNDVIVDINPLGVRMMGRDKVHLIGKPYTDFFRHVVFDTSAEENPGQSANRDGVLVRPDDGVQVPVLWNSMEIEHGDLRLWLLSWIDVTALKQAENEMKHRDRLQQALAETIGFLLMKAFDANVLDRTIAMLGAVLGVDRVYIFQNFTDPATGQLLAVLRHEWTSGAATAQKDNPALQNLSWERHWGSWCAPMLRGRAMWGAVSTFPDVLQQALAPMQAISSLIVPIRVENQFWGVLGFDDCRRERDWAGAEVAVLTLAAKSIGGAQRLISAKYEAESGVRAKSDFLAAMTHELRTPMGGIIGMGRLMLDTPLSGEQREYVTTVIDCANSLLKIVDDILDFSKMESGHMHLEILEFDLRRMCEDMNEILAVKADEKRLEYTFQLDSGIPVRVKGDPGRLRRILTNLIGNAIKFTQSGSVSIEGALESQEAERIVLKFSVRDTGIGIAPEQADKLFQPFSQLDVSTSRRFGGTGLGLAISRRLVEMMGGQIGYEHAQPRGTVFWFTAVLARGGGALTDAVYDGLVGRSVLVVDDSAENLEALGHLLGEFRCRVVLESDSMQVLSRLGRETYDIVIVDLVMPGMTGIALGEVMNRDVRLQKQPRILMTSLMQWNVSLDYEKAGFSTALTKPVKKDELYQAMVHCLVPSAAARDGGGLQRFSVPVKVLVAEDDLTNQKVIIRTFEKLGCQAQLVDNGRRVIQALTAEVFDIVFLDLRMPELDGVAAAGIIRDPKSPVREHGVPVIAMTADTSDETRRICLETGMNDLVCKPAAPEEIFQKIQQWVFPERKPEEIFTYGAMLKRLGDDLPLLVEVVNLFLKEAVGLVGALQKADPGSSESVSLAHQLKGAAATAGAQGLRTLFQDIETGLHSGAVDQVKLRFLKIDRELAQYREAVRRQGIPVQPGL